MAAGERKVLLRAAAVPAGPLCPGDPLELDASGNSNAGCTGAPVYSFMGPGVPPSHASTPLARAPAVHDPAGTRSVTLA